MSDDTPCLTDSAGHMFKPHQGPARIVSLSAPLTDLLLALDLESQLVGSEVRADRIVTSRFVGTALAPDLDRIKELEPTHILIDPRDTPRTVQDLLYESGLDIIAMAPKTIQDNFHMFCFFGALFNVQDNADTLSRRFEAGLARVKMAMRTTKTRRILYLANKDPWRTCAKDSYVASLFGTIHIHPVTGPDGDIILTDIPQALLLSVDKVLFNGAPNLFRRADLKAFAKRFDLPAGKVLRLDMDPARQFGVRAIEMLDTLPGLRAVIDEGL